jgi:hypothetical protein
MAQTLNGEVQGLASPSGLVQAVSRLNKLLAKLNARSFKYRQDRHTRCCLLASSTAQPLAYVRCLSLHDGVQSRVTAEQWTEVVGGLKNAVVLPLIAKRRARSVKRKS